MFRPLLLIAASSLFLGTAACAKRPAPTASDVSAGAITEPIILEKVPLLAEDLAEKLTIRNLRVVRDPRQGISVTFEIENIQPQEKLELEANLVFRREDGSIDSETERTAINLAPFRRFFFSGMTSSRSAHDVDIFLRRPERTL